ncbi:hypothetical protein KORDIASMS9_02037 [Kordia sp. SMS9]|uniref:hypothetical protein n=1 Tax=Kordia sp. SMS9 TaxID=2282170 RepID=UPI000E103943|nr:hypothetical protein [Kordia sp. SMS9]AXG69809.1 hypothetical protein KORDIASMS9_02037 [Kordia sp. SMS9]
MRTFIFYILITIWFTSSISCTPEALDCETSADDTLQAQVDPQTEEEDDELEPSK